VGIVSDKLLVVNFGFRLDEYYLGSTSLELHGSHLHRTTVGIYKVGSLEAEETLRSQSEWYSTLKHINKLVRNLAQNGKWLSSKGIDWHMPLQG
jgi:hypothetical protein